MEPNEFKKMVEDIRSVELAMGKICYGPSEQEIQNTTFRRSIFAVKDITKGERLTEENIKVIRPSYGLEPKYYSRALTMVAKTTISKGTPLNWDLIE